jgi:hypothetical protein
MYLREKVVAAGDEQTVSRVAAPPEEGEEGDPDAVGPQQAENHEGLACGAGAKSSEYHLNNATEEEGDIL